jgi:hypothetical protein
MVSGVVGIFGLLSVAVNEDHIFTVPICGKLDALSVSLALAPVAFIPCAVSADVDSISIFLSVEVLAVVVVAVGPGVFTLSVRYSVLEIALVSMWG